MVAMRWGLLAFLALSVLCAEPVAAADRDYLVVARPSDIKTLDPTVETSDIASSLYKSLYDQLTETGTDGSIGPKLATSFSASEDAKTWTFKIRGDAKLPDGSSLTADDVVWTYRTILGDATSPMKAFVAQVESVEKTAPDTVVFHLNTAFGAFDRQVSLISVVQQKSFETMGRPAFAQKGVGSGPYQVVNWVRDSQIELAANPHWWGKPVAIKKIILRLREHPEMTLAQHDRVIEHAIAHPWWQGPASPSVVYGNGAQFERSVHAATLTPPEPTDDAPLDEAFLERMRRGDGPVIDATAEEVTDGGE